MGLIGRKKTPESVIPSPSKLVGMQRDDLYLLIETSLMEAQMNLARVRSAPEEDKTPLLQWLESDIRTAMLGTLEYESRI
jgi:hypothetical protein